MPPSQPVSIAIRPGPWSRRHLSMVNAGQCQCCTNGTDGLHSTKRAIWYASRQYTRCTYPSPKMVLRAGVTEGWRSISLNGWQKGCGKPISSSLLSSRFEVPAPLRAVESPESERGYSSSSRVSAGREHSELYASWQMAAAFDDDDGLYERAATTHRWRDSRCAAALESGRFSPPDNR
jgi:hypothetical protein